jgi:pimeloyl-ACP methyl ester carboxylesterase
MVVPAGRMREGDHRMDGSIHVDEYGAGDPALFIHGSMGWGLDSFPDQVELADKGFQIRLMDRRGFGRSPDVDVVDVLADAQDAADLLVEPTRVVGQSSGGVVALLASAMKPTLVKSLVLIEPAVLGLAVDDPVVAQYIENLSSVYAKAPESTPEEFYAQFIRAGGGVIDEPPSLSEDDARAIRSTMTERPWWSVPIPMQEIARASFPTLVCVGGRAGYPESSRALSGHAWVVASRRLAELIGATVVVFDGSGHNPQLEEPALFNAVLEDFWRRPEQTRGVEQG